MNHRVVKTLCRAAVVLFAFIALIVATGCADKSGHKVAEDMVDAIARGDFASATKNIDGKVKGLLSEDRIRLNWKEISEKSGAFIGRTKTWQETREGRAVVVVTLKFEKFVWDVSVWLTDYNTIGMIKFTANNSLNPPYASPSYVHEDRYVERTIIIKHQKWQLHGILALPVTDKRCPVVILVPATSMGDRDSSYSMNRPYRDIAGGLASQGIAVLRYDGLSSYKDNLKEIVAITENWTAKDEETGVVDAAIALCRKRKEIDQKRIYVLGHDYSGYLLPRVGKEHPDIAGMILSAAIARRPEDVILDGVVYKLQVSEPVLSADSKKLVADIRRAKAEIAMLTPASDSSRRVLYLPVSYWLDLKDYDAAGMAKSLKQPILMLQTGRDYDTTEEDNRIWSEALGSKSSVTIKNYPKLNHYYVQGEGRITQTEYVMPGNVSEQVVNDIAGWIHKQR